MEEFSKGDYVWITNVDMYGYQGRDHHPEKYDEGSLVEVVRVEKYEANTEEDPYLVLTCCTFGQDARLIELIDHEVEKSLVKVVN